MAQVDTPQALKRTPLYDVHQRLGAKLVPFAGYEMPVQYPSGITAEHRAVRERAGLFDVSHMGEFIVRGPGALDFVNYVTTNNVGALAVGQVQYSAILNERGTFEDDCLVYRFADRVMIVVNASNAAKDLAHIARYQGRFDCTVEDASDRIALLALQGPEAARVLARLTSVDLAAIRYYYFAEGTVAGVPDVIVSRTGYTGEDGFELYFDAERAVELWEALVADPAVVPAGLGSRDSLRLEMGMALYGNDIDEHVTPYEAGLGWVVKLQKGDFVGREALVAQKERGVERRLVGFTTGERSFPRQGYPVYHGGVRHAEVRSGTLSPTLGTPIGTCYLPPDAAVEGTEFEIEIRGKRVPARVVKTPFYKRPGAK
ncbi:MAG: Aminomethyltransferase (glycine cleavage system T protein) [uncultured Gemmatimonadaceae bacterium]|uniref:Aminomethyltransferase n=1 Tax=uncultured Gemmatimonadaceae bacterium TaxID=246130 RepID=A0A6J4KT38_9BACT|nr:MAG: Aminomethyltransferase (glycine cleavage system T protein) [uncultured Gemmatimonadaceae bacterium]